MFSTIDARRSFTVLRFCGAAAGILGLWMVVAGLAAFAEPTSTVTIFGPQAALMRAASRSDVELLNAGRGFMIVRGHAAGFVRSLYVAGAWAVLPGGIGACGSSFYAGARVSRRFVGDFVG
jgi:hypothetical protein